MGRHRKLAFGLSGPAIVRLLTTAAVQALESRAITQAGPGVLMQRAGRAVAQQAQLLLRRLPGRPQILALIGPGNNGADALVAATLLQSQGYQVSVTELFPQARRDAVSGAVFTQARGVLLRWIDPSQAECILDGTARTTRIAAVPDQAWLVLDGLFGIGLKRPLEGAAQTLVEASHRRDPQTVRVLSIDLPSGLNADTGLPIGSLVMRADLTLTLLADKPGLHTGQAARWCGQVQLDTLGVEAQEPDAEGLGGAVVSALPPGAPHPAGELYSMAQARTDRPVRMADDHKGRFGDLLVIQGTAATQGAAHLALLGAQAVGAGRLFLGRDTPGAADPGHPEFMSRLLRKDTEGPEALGDAAALVIGCGLGQDAQAIRCLEQAIPHPAALVLDADALNLLAVIPALRTSLSRRGQSRREHRVSEPTAHCVITPHPLEAARLLGTSVQAVQADRLTSATTLARTLDAVVVLKGAGTVVADPDGRWSVNASGGPLLAVAGTGDVLAGVIGGLLAQGLSLWRAARLGVWLHGAAADALSGQAQWSGGIGLATPVLAPAIRRVLNTLMAAQAGSC
jgi:hydroxyethylthiazole kinase-like uncharacterized protein yjeF